MSRINNNYFLSLSSLGNHQENVLVDFKGQAIITDFGNAVDRSNFEETEVPLSEWRAPELLPRDKSEKPNVTCQSDIYAFGVLCMEVLSTSLISKSLL